MTIRATKKESTNRFDRIPSEKATAAVKEDTRAEWLEGIPPVRQIMVSKISRALLRRLNITTAAFTICAINQLEIADKKMGFSKKAFNEAALKEIATDIV
jgi:hypothetical protein